MSLPNKEEIVCLGLPAVPGVVCGPAFLYSNGEMDVPKYSIPPEKREEEIARFEQGLMETRKQISSIRAEVQEKVGEEEATIFDAHQLVLDDRALIEETIKEVISSGYNIEHCYQTVASRYIDAFTRIDDDYIKERVSDIRDVTRRLLYNLLGHAHQKISDLTHKNILVADDLTPSEAATLNVESIIGIVTEMGSRTSHAVIVARSLNIPCVVGVHDLPTDIAFGDLIMVDGFNGRVVLNPTPETLEKSGQLQTERDKQVARYELEKLQPCITRDKRHMPLLLNIDGMEPDRILLNSGAEGVGLFRTEMMFLRDNQFPNEDQQFKAYKDIVTRCSPHVVTIRTLDLGGDKNPHNSLYGYQEANPFMGFRAIRFCLEYKDVFKEQLRAILRASAFGRAKIMYPMISSCEEMIAANQLLEEAKDELRKRRVKFDENIQRGCMIEVPSAAVITDLLAQHCDFFSIGTNDLIQYMLAVDRVNDRIAHLYQPSHPAIMRTLNFIFEGGRRNKVPVSVCGELAGDPLYAALLFGMGASELSLSWSSVSEIKYFMRRISLKEARKLALAVLRSTTTDQIETLLLEFSEKTMRTADKAIKAAEPLPV